MLAAVQQRKKIKKKLFLRMKNLKKIGVTIVFAASTLSTFAGGILTNTNQSISFLRNPARDAAIGIDGVYHNPAGVAFLEDGFHFAFGWQSARQTRVINTTNPLFALGARNNGHTTKEYKGEATAPFLPTVQAAYNKNRWSLQFNFALNGGGGKAEFNNGLGSFESAIGGIAYQLGQTSKRLHAAGIAVPQVTGYNADSYMMGRQYYFGFTLGAAYKLNDNWSIYLGARALYGTASYKVNIQNIQAMAGTTGYSLPDYFKLVEKGFQTKIASVVAQYVASGLTQEQAMQQAPVKALLKQAEQLNASAAQLAPYADGVKLQSDQTGFGIAPIIGVDYKTGNFNFAAKYEFLTRMELKNNSTVKEASLIEAVNKFRDGTKIDEDSPALLTLGAQWTALPNVRINAGYHHYFDKSAKKYGNAQKLPNNDTNEYLGGVEYDPIDKLTVSAGFQITRYGLSDKYMNDMSFVVNSWSYGIGAKYRFNERIAVEAAYFRTNYDNYKTSAADANGSVNDYTRTNNVLGVGVNVTL